MVFREDELLANTRDSTIWNVDTDSTKVEIHVNLPPKTKTMRDIYLRIEVINDYNPIEPTDTVPVGVTYKRDCMRFPGHPDGVIPEAEIPARGVRALVYREYLGSDYLVPKTNKLVEADINEPAYHQRVPGTVIYAHPGEILKTQHIGWESRRSSRALHFIYSCYGGLKCSKLRNIPSQLSHFWFLYLP